MLRRVIVSDIGSASRQRCAFSGLSREYHERYAFGKIASCRAPTSICITHYNVMNAPSADLFPNCIMTKKTQR